MKADNFQLVTASILLVISIALAFAALVFAILWEITWIKRKKKPFKISKEVDYIMSRGVKTI